MAVNRVTLTINSRQYTVVAEESKEYIEKLCNHINDKVEKVRKGGQNILGERPVVLAALNICDEYFKLNEQYKKREEELETYRLQLSRLQNVPNIPSGQVTIEESAMRDEITSAKDSLNSANKRIEFLEGQVKNLEGRLRGQQNNNKGRKS